MHTRRTSPARGFSLVETLVVLTIVGLLAGVGTAIYLRNVNNARQASVVDTLRTIDQNARGLAGDDSPWPHLQQAAAGVDMPQNELDQGWGIQTVDEAAGYVTFRRFDICGILHAEPDGRPGDVDLYDCNGTPPSPPPPPACVPPDTPGFSVPDVTTNPDGSATIDWLEPAGVGDGIAGYRVVIDDGADDRRTLDVTSPPPAGTEIVITQVTVSNLPDATDYTVTLAAYGPAGPEDCLSAAATTSFTSTIDPPGTDRPVLTAEGRDEAIQLNWDLIDTSQTDYYQLRRTVTANPSPTTAGDWDTFPLTPDGSTTTVTLLDDGLTNGTRYHYQVRAVDTDGSTSPWSNIAAAVPTDTVASGDTTLTATAGERQVDLSWVALDDTDTYRIFRRDITTTDPLVELDTVPGSSLTYTDTAVDPFVTYEYKVTGVDEAGNESGQSNPATATPYDTTPPACPTGLTATAVDHNDNDGDYDDVRVDFTWTGPDPDPVTFTLFLTDDTFQTFGQNATTTYTRYFDDVPEAVYSDVRVEVTDPWGNTSTCPLGTTLYVDYTPPTAPTLTVDDNRHQEILVTWTQSTDNVSGVDTYTLQGRAPAGSWTTLSTVAAADTRSYLHTGPAWNQTWDYRVIVSDRAGNTATSTVASGTFADLIPPEDDGLSLTAINSGFRISLVFATLEDDGTSEYSGVANHAYRWRSNTTGNFSSTVGGWSSWQGTGSTTNNITSGIVYNRYYQVQVRVRDAAGNPNYTAAVVHANVDTTPPSITVTQPFAGERENGILNLAAVATDSYSGINSSGVTFALRCNACRNGGSWNSFDNVGTDTTPNSSDVFARNVRIVSPTDDFGVRNGEIRANQASYHPIPNGANDVRGSVCDAAGNCASDIGGRFTTHNVAKARYGGLDRDETSAIVSRNMFPNGASHVVITRSFLGADPLSAAPVAAALRSPLLVTAGGAGNSNLHPDVRTELIRLENRNPGMRIILVGGTGALASSIETEIEGICGCSISPYYDGSIDNPGGPFGTIPTNARLAGSNRAFTNAMLAELGIQRGSWTSGSGDLMAAMVNTSYDLHKLIGGAYVAQGSFGAFFLSHCHGANVACNVGAAGHGSGRYSSTSRHGWPWVIHNWIDSRLPRDFFSQGVAVGDGNFLNTESATLFRNWVVSFQRESGALPRIARYISKHTFEAGSTERRTTVFLARQDSWADALSTAPAISQENGTLLLSAYDSIPYHTCVRLTQLRPRRIVALGGTSAITVSALNQAQDIAQNWNTHSC